MPLLWTLLLRDLARQAGPLALHALAVAVAAFLVVVLAAAAAAMGREDAPGLPCASELRRLELRDRDGALQVAPDVVAAALAARSSLRVHVLQVQALDGGGLALLDAPLREALCLAIPARDGATVHALAGRDARVPPGILEVRRVPGLDGLAGAAAGSAWIRAEDAPWLRLAPDARDGVLLVERRPGQAWAALEAEVAGFVAAGGAALSTGTRPRWIKANGVALDAMERAQRGLALLAIVALGILVLVATNLSTWFIGRHPRFALTSTTLVALGLRRSRLGWLAAVEPVVLVLVGLPLGALAARAWLAEQPGAGNAFADAAGDGVVLLGSALVLGAAAAVVTWRRVAATRGSLRPGAAGFKRLSGQAAGWLVAAQVAAAIPLVALALQAGAGWAMDRARAPSLPAEEVWMARWTVPDGRAAAGLEALRAVEAMDTGVAVASDLLPLPGGGAAAAPAELVVGLMPWPVLRVHASPRALAIAHGVAPEVAEAWLAEAPGAPPGLVASDSVLAALDQRPALAGLRDPGDATARPHAWRGMLPDQASRWRVGEGPVGVVVVAWPAGVEARAGVLLASGPEAPLARLQRAADRLGARIDAVEPARAAALRVLAAERQMAQSFALMAVTGLACLLIGLVSVARGMEVARGLELSVVFALGASRRDLARRHARGLWAPGLPGLAVGLGLAAAATGVVSSTRPLLAPLAWPATLGALALVVAVALPCILWSARRVARADLAPALRAS